MRINKHDGYLDNLLSPTTFNLRKHTDQPKFPDSAGKGEGKLRASKKKCGKGDACEKMNTIGKTTEPWLTICLDGSQEGSLELNLAQLTKTLLLPSTTKPMKTSSTEVFLIFTPKFYETQHSNLSGLPLEIQNVEERPQKHHKKDHQLLELQTTHPVQFMMCDDSVCESIWAQPDARNEETFVWELSFLTSVSLQGICVSMWMKNKSMGCFKEEDGMSSFNVVGKGHGPRKSFFSVGIHAYFGSRHSSRPRPNQGKGALLFQSDCCFNHCALPE